MELGKDMEDTVIEEKIDAQKPEKCALLVYTVSDVVSELQRLVSSSGSSLNDCC